MEQPPNTTGALVTAGHAVLGDSRTEGPHPSTTGHATQTSSSQSIRANGAEALMATTQQGHALTACHTPPTCSVFSSFNTESIPIRACVHSWGHLPTAIITPCKYIYASSNTGAQSHTDKPGMERCCFFFLFLLNCWHGNNSRIKVSTFLQIAV